MTTSDFPYKTAFHYNLQYLFDESRTFGRVFNSARWWEAKINKFLYNLEVAVMPRKGESSKGKFNQNDFQFVNFKLNQAEAAEFTTWCNKLGEKGLDALAKMTSDGYKPSVRWDEDNVCFIASWTCIGAGDTNHNMCLTSRSADWYEALMLGVYKHTVVFKSGDWPREQRGANWG